MTMAKEEVTVVNPWGMHARSAMRFVQTALPYDATVTVACHDVEPVDGKDVMSLLSLGASLGTKLTIEAVGADADEAVAKLSELVADGFGEMPKRNGP